jgi:hypothetical protein
MATKATKRVNAIVDTPPVKKARRKVQSPHLRAALTDNLVGHCWIRAALAQYQEEKTEKADAKEARAKERKLKAKAKAAAKPKPRAKRNKQVPNLDGNGEDEHEDDQEGDADRTSPPPLQDGELIFEKAKVCCILSDDDWVSRIIVECDHVVFRFDDNLWYKSEGDLREGTCSDTNNTGLYVCYDDGARVVHTEMDLATYNDRWWLLEANIERKLQI